MLPENSSTPIHISKKSTKSPLLQQTSKIEKVSGKKVIRDFIAFSKFSSPILFYMSEKKNNRSCPMNMLDIFFTQKKIKPEKKNTQPHIYAAFGP